MKITFNAQTALRIIRTLRKNRTSPASWGKKVDLVSPDPSPGKRFTGKLFDFPDLGLEWKTGQVGEIHVAVPGKDLRLRMASIRNTIYGSELSLPQHSFIEVGDGVAISCPELVFLEMAGVLSLAQLLVLGYELCGSFSRDPDDPMNGSIVYDCPPVTSCEAIGAFIHGSKRNAHAKKALYALAFLSDNAWSPTEAIVAALASLPYEEFGYGFGPCVLNKRVDITSRSANSTAKGSRVPDILFPGTPVGLNYDGAVHLNLDLVVQTAMELERNPGQAAIQRELDTVVSEVRAKVVDDIRRNRELAAEGFIVLPVTKEDLYEEGGLDSVMLQAMKTIEGLTGCNLSEQKRQLEIRFCRERRQELIWSLLPGKHPVHVKGSIGGETRVIEVIVGF